MIGRSAGDGRTPEAIASKVSVAIVTQSQSFIAQSSTSILNQSRDFKMEVVIGEALAGTERGRSSTICSGDFR